MYNREDGYGMNNNAGQPPLFQNTKYTLELITSCWLLLFYYYSPAMTSFSSVGATLSNPIVTEAAVQYGQGLVNMGQSYLDRNV